MSSNGVPRRTPRCIRPQCRRRTTQTLRPCGGRTATTPPTSLSRNRPRCSVAPAAAAGGGTTRTHEQRSRDARTYARLDLKGNRFPWRADNRREKSMKGEKTNPDQKRARRVKKRFPSIETGARRSSKHNAAGFSSHPAIRFWELGRAEDPHLLFFALLNRERVWVSTPRHRSSHAELGKTSCQKQNEPLLFPPLRACVCQ